MYKNGAKIINDAKAINVCIIIAKSINEWGRCNVDWLGKKVRPGTSVKIKVG